MIPKLTSEDNTLIFDFNLNIFEQTVLVYISLKTSSYSASIYGDFWWVGSGVTLLFEHSPSWVSEIEYFEIFSCPQENKLAQLFFVKFN